MQYLSTRGNHSPEKSASAILMGMVPEGGLFVPEQIPARDTATLLDGVDNNYAELAARILSLFLDDFSREELTDFARKAYSQDNFQAPDVAPLHHLKDGPGVLELWHGPTAAFKDLALQLLPYLLSASADKVRAGKEIVILVATSGDTGKAALEGFRDVPGTRIIVFYPEKGVSQVQKLQMVTTAGENTSVVGVQGNFDDCQTMVKEMFASASLREKLNAGGFAFSSANSINWGRLVPQIVYYYWAYARMQAAGKLQSGERCNIVVPTGNFGNILAAWYAREMGLPVKKLICASNRNRVLSDFFKNGVYNKNRRFYRTASPSMDILISSNLERFLYHMAGNDHTRIIDWYATLGKTGKFQVSDRILARMQTVLYADFADEKKTRKKIAEVFTKEGYLMDPHTAVGMEVYDRYRGRTGDETPAILDSTASPFKFNKAVYRAISGKKGRKQDELALLNTLEQYSGKPVHRSLNNLESLPKRHQQVISPGAGKAAVEDILGLNK